MLIYFDESYDNKHRYLLLGALFNPHPKFLHRRMTEIKKSHTYFTPDGGLRELKYNLCYCEPHYRVAEEIVDAFFESTSWFRCIVIEQSKLDLSYFGKPHEPKDIKQARAYKKFAELLIAHNTEDVVNGVLLTDKLTRCHGDRFLELMKDAFCTPLTHYSAGKHEPTLRHIDEVSSKLEQYQVLQVCDLLMGCVLNNLVPTANPWKVNIRDYLIKRLRVKSLLPSEWSHYSKTRVETYYPKFNVWYWKPQAKP